MRRFIVVLLTWSCSLYAVGQQHAIFRSQSTQGAKWFGTSAIVAERYRITVMPDYLDVELDWELNVGGSQPDSFANALEIVGNINIAQDAAVTGMLLWNGDEILKAKLKPIRLAREQYEDVVDRNADIPPPPRDPVIFEYGWERDNYYISIFPASWGKTRKLRMRYLIPAVNLDGVAKVPYPHAFAPGIATITMLRGPGVKAFAIERTSGVETLVAADSISFTSSSATYQGIDVIRPSREAAPSTTVIYAAGFETGSFSGVMSHVVGIPAQKILEKAGLADDYAILWRWNHPGVLAHYAKQIVMQSGLLKAFVAQVAAKGERAALIVDIQDRERILFELSGKGSRGFDRMVAWLDSLSAMAYDEPGPFSKPDMSEEEVESMLAESVRDFERSVEIAMTLFEKNHAGRNIVVVLTAGPRWIDQTVMTAPIALENGVALAPLYDALDPSLRGSSGIWARDLYWPGVSVPSGGLPRNTYTVTATVANASGSAARSFQATLGATYRRTRYSWYYEPADLDLKLYGRSPLKPVVEWAITSGSQVVARVSEIPKVVALFDGSQFARTMAGSRHLQTMDGALPSSLASTFGFVDPDYALLALEKDVMPSADQDRFRDFGVPVLTPAEITGVEDRGFAEQSVVGEPAAVAVSTARMVVSPVTRLRAWIAAGHLVLRMPDRLRTANRDVRIEVYTVSGRLLARLDARRVGNSTVRADLPAALLAAGRTLVFRIEAGGESFCRQIAVR